MSSAATATAVATALQTAIRAVSGFASATVTYLSTANGGSGAYIISAESTSPIVITNAVNNNGQQVGTDVSVALGWRNPTRYIEGFAAETLASGLNAMIALTTAGQPVLIMIDGDVPAQISSVDTREALATFINSGEYFGFIRDNDPDALDICRAPAGALQISLSSTSLMHNAPANVSIQRFLKIRSCR